MDLKTLVVGTRETIAGTVYGTIIVLSEVTAAASAYQNDLSALAVIVAVTMVVFWAAHVYSVAIGDSIDLGRKLSATELARIARRESSMLLAAVLPVLLLALGAAGVLGRSTALWLVVAVGIVTLTAEGVRYARLERLSRASAVLTVGVNLALGLAIAGLKALVAH
ncbi:MAG: hypothetical protein ACTHQQ_01525 [Solirubrobacteraceae bacterium]